jgi:UDP-2,3-diacylglucosamine hydrolase
VRDSGMAILIHGHTHRPGSYPLNGSVPPAQRWVLPDWDLDADVNSRRGGYLDLRHGTPALHRLP